MGGRTQRYLGPGEGLSNFKELVDDRFFLRIGVINSVDNERNLVSIHWADDLGGVVNIPISQPAAGSGGISYMPDEGDYVICGVRRLAEDTGQPVILEYIPTGYELHKNAGRGVLRRYFTTKLYPGEVSISSNQGSEIIVDSDISIKDSNFNEIGLDSSSGTFKVVADGQDIRLGGVKTQAGVVLREGIQEDSRFNSESFPMAYNGRVIPIVTRGGVSIDGISVDNPDTFKPAFTEFRIEAQDGYSGVKDLFEIRDSFVDTPPVVELVIGSNIGNRPGTVLYGKPFRNQIFSSNDSMTPQVTDVLLDVTSDIDETATVMPVYFLRVPFSGLESPPTTISIDKEGQYFAYIASSKTHPNGIGNSAEIATGGRVKMFLGSNPSGVSLKTGTAGGWQGNFGKTVETGRSIDFNLDGSAHITYRADSSGIARYSEIIGDDIEVIHGSKTLDYRSPTKVIYPTKEEEITGSSSLAVTGDASATYGSNYDETITGTKSSRIVKGRATVIASSADSGVADDLQILEGDKNESLLLGSKNITLTSGDFTETIVSGNRSISITTGNIEFSTVSGDVSIKSNTGSINIEALAQSVNIKAGLNFLAQAGAKAEVKAPQVFIGSGATSLDGIITFKSHKDYITGQPLVPCLSAFAGP